MTEGEVGRKLEGRDHLGDVVTDRRLILKWVFKNMYMVQGCEQDFSGLWQSSVAGLCELGNESLHLKNDE